LKVLNILFSQKTLELNSIKWYIIKIIKCGFTDYMKMTIQNPHQNFKQSIFTMKNKLTYITNISLLCFFVAISFTGLVMLNFHSGASKIHETVLTLTGKNWHLLHKILISVFALLAVTHIILHPQWIKNTFVLRTFPKSFTLKVTLLLFVIYLINAAIAFPAWLFIKDKNIDSILHGIHSKTGLLLIVFFILHLIQHFKWLFTKSKQLFQTEPV